MLLLGHAAAPYLSAVDCFTADHPVAQNEPLVIRSTPTGGYCSVLCFCIMVLALIFFGNRYQLRYLRRFENGRQSQPNHW